MSLDREVINLRLARIENCLAQLEPFSSMSELSFLARYDRYHEAKYILATALNAVSQVSAHIQRSLGERNDDPVGDLMEAGVLEEELGDRLRRQLRLLGTLARAHFDEDRDILYQIVSEELPDLAQFAREVTLWMDRRNGEPAEAP